VQDDNSGYDPLQFVSGDTMHRDELQNYKVMEPKMCENCDATFLRTVGSPVKYCRNCQSPASEPGKAYENLQASIALLSTRIRRDAE
jgi:ribosomal protein L37AE/L43A